jgi:hypothetical protein
MKLFAGRIRTTDRGLTISDLYDEPSSAPYALHVRHNVLASLLQQQDITIRSFD